MLKDDPRRDDDLNWSSRKLSARTLQKNQVAAALGGNAVTRSLLSSPAAQTAAGTLLVGAAPKAVRALPKLIRAASSAVAAGGAQVAAEAGVSTFVGTASIAGVLAAAGLTSYFTTKWILERSSRRSEALALASDAYRKARADMAAQLGRALTAAELKALADHYKAVTAEIRSRIFI